MMGAHISWSAAVLISTALVDLESSGITFLSRTLYHLQPACWVSGCPQEGGAADTRVMHPADASDLGVVGAPVPDGAIKEEAVGAEPQAPAEPAVFSARARKALGDGGEWAERSARCSPDRAESFATDALCQKVTNHEAQKGCHGLGPDGVDLEPASVGLPPAGHLASDLHHGQPLGLRR